MPLNTQIKRKGRTLPVRWGGFHVAAMVFAATWEHGEGPFVDNRDPRDREDGIKVIDRGVERTLDYPTEAWPISGRDSFDLVSYPVISATRLNAESVTLTKPHKFHDNMDGEVFELQPGDVLTVWRD